MSHSLWRRVFGAGATLALALGSTTFVGCSDDDNPTDPGGNDDPGLAVTGTGALATPARADFVATSSRISGSTLVWDDDGTVVPAPSGLEVVTLSVTQDGSTSGASSAGIEDDDDVWVQVGSPVTGISIGTENVTFTDCVLTNQTDGTTIILNGFLPVPTSSGPSAPTGVAASGIHNGVSVSWDSDSAASHNVYWSTQPGVTPGNAEGSANDTNGSPYVISTFDDYSTLYVIVTAVDASQAESDPSTEITVTPGGQFSTLDVTGSGAALLDRTTFDPVSSWPGNLQQAVYLWNDPTTNAVLAVFYNRATDEIRHVYVYTATRTWGVTDGAEVAGAMVSGSTFVFTNCTLTGEFGESTSLVLNGTLGRGTVTQEGGSLVLSGTDVGVVTDSGFAPDDTNTISGSQTIEFADSTDGVTLQVTLGSSADGVTVLTLTDGSASWSFFSLTTGADVTMDGEELTFNNVELTPNTGTTATDSIFLNGTITW